MAEGREAYPGELQDLIESVSEVHERLARQAGAKHPLASMMSDALTQANLVMLRVALGAWHSLPKREKQRLLGTDE